MKPTIVKIINFCLDVIWGLVIMSFFLPAIFMAYEIAKAGVIITPIVIIIFFVIGFFVVKSSFLKLFQKGLTVRQIKIKALITVLLITIVSVILIPKLLHTTGHPRWHRARGDIASLNLVLSLYKKTVESNQYPLILKQLLEDDAPGWDGPYMAGTEIKKDPWGGEYKYISDGNDYVIESSGAPEGTPNVGYSTLRGVMYTF